MPVSPVGNYAALSIMKIGFLWLLLLIAAGHWAASAGHVVVTTSDRRMLLTPQFAIVQAQMCHASVAKLPVTTSSSNRAMCSCPSCFQTQSDHNLSCTFRHIEPKRTQETLCLQRAAAAAAAALLVLNMLMQHAKLQLPSHLTCHTK